ncbi:MAG TPA: histidine kinase [Cyanobacteria bacterium UBA8553]|nr:histidine kinase [Cyanobacteria bacterium UBA8553]
MDIPITYRDSPLTLVVDDDKFMRIQLRHAMQQVGYQVVEASDGEEALTAFNRIQPDIVLLDALMPVMDGFTCCKQLRNLPDGEHTPVLMITALEDRESVDLAFEVGANDYITKPIHWAVLHQRVRRLLETSRSTTELRQQMARAQLSEARLQLALEAAQMVTWDWDVLSGNVVYSATTEANQRLVLRLFDSTDENFLANVHPEDQLLIAQAVRCTLEEGADYNIEFRVIWPDDTVHWVASKGQVYYDEKGIAVRMTGINMDISDRKQAEKERIQLLEKEQVARTDSEAAHQRIANILESITDAFFALDNDWQITYLNQQAEQILQRTRAELLGRNLWDEFPEAVGSVFFEQYHKAVSEQVSVEFEALSPWLNKWFNVHAYPARDGLSVYFQDITDRKQAHEELQRQTMRSQLFAEVTLKIRQSLQIDEILQTTVTEVQRIFQTDRVLIFQLKGNGFGKIVTEVVNPQWPSVLGRNINEDYFASEYLQRYSQGRVYTVADIEKAKVPNCLIEFMKEFNVKAKLAVPIFLKEKLWGLMVAHQCNNPRHWSSFETELMGHLAIQIGIALAQAQLLQQETHQRLELARSNAELQQFASIASHDLQEPLRKIQAFSNRLKDKYSEVLTEQGRDYLERMHNAALRMQNLINDLLTLSRVTTKAQPFVPVNLAQVTQEVLSDLEVCIQQNRGHVDVGELPTIDADPIQMRQLLQNLISNALKFHRKEEPHVVKIYSQRMERQDNLPTGGSPVGEYCQIIVEDNGIGFDEKYLDRIFNVFQRLHSRSEYEGTGMGLAICRKIAERHGGSITAESTLGQGAKFIVTLPIQQRIGENTA